MSLATDPRSNVRSWILLGLALVPIIGALIGSVAVWQSEGTKLDALESQRNLIGMSYRNAAFTDDFQSAYFRTLASATEPSDVSLQEQAETARIRAIETGERASADVSALARVIAREFGVDAAFFEQVLEPVYTQATSALGSQVVGEPPSAMLEAASRSVVANLQGQLVSGSDSPYIAVNNTKGVLFGYLEYQADAGAAMSALLPFALDSQVTNDEFRDLLDDAAAETETNWLDTVLQINFLPQASQFEFRENSRNDPFKVVLTESDKQTFVANGLGFLDTVSRDAATAETLSLAAVETAEGNVKKQRARAVLLGFTVFALTLTLLRMAWLEVRARQRVQALHDAAIEKLADQVRTDPLTGAWNRRHINEVLQDRLDQQSTQGQVILAYLDLDRFKALNDVWGHSVGDQLLKIVTRRLRAVTFRGRNADVVRFGGDEFVCFIQLKEPQTIDASQFGEVLLEALRPPVRLAGRVHSLSATAGLAVSNAKSTPHTLILEADTSLIDAKRTHRGSLLLYNRQSSQTSELLNRLPNAMANREIRVHMQPVYDIATGELIHAEALARWQPPGEEMVMPAKFIHLVETFGMAALLTTAVLEDVAAIISERLIPDTTTVWINAAPVELESHEFADRLLGDLERLDLVGRIGLEITETAAVADPVHFASQTSQLREAGVSIAIDDFGSGYSPLGLLQDLPIDVVKLDRSLISHIDSKNGHQHLVRGIIALIHEQGRSIIAEGVEREEELGWLRDHGVGSAQGYLMARPLDPRTSRLPLTFDRDRAC